MLFFIDESGHDKRESPYEVLAAVAVNEKDLWNLIQAIRALEIQYFGLSRHSVGLELKGKKLLKSKTFRLAKYQGLIDPSIRMPLAKSFIEKGWIEGTGGEKQTRSAAEYAAYGQAVLDFISALLQAAARFHVRVFASIVSKNAPCQEDDFLRKDYTYLFERFYYYLEDRNPSEMGLIVFDELEKTKSHILLGQMERYFKGAGKGSQRSSRIIPEPFFVHSDLTTLVQLADIVAYCLNWAARFKKKMVEPIRPEIKPYADLILDMQYRGKRQDQDTGKEWDVYGVQYLDDLRPRAVTLKGKIVDKIKKAMLGD